MSSYPYVLYPALLLNFMSEQGETCDFNVGDRVQIKEQFLQVADKPNSQHLWKQLYKFIDGFVTIPAWTKVRHALVLLPGIILLLAVIKGFVILGIFGDYGWLVLIIFGLGGAILLWLVFHSQVGQVPNSHLTQKGQKFIQSTLPESFSHLQKKESLPLNDKNQKLHRLKQLKLKLYQKVRQPVGVSDAPVGASERKFKAVLEQHFCCLRVQTQLKFPVTINGKEYAYSTDFAIIFEEIGLSIDVEIDEPYDYKSKKPTHCVDQPNDMIRNQYFIEGNWIVIRFSEAQIVLYPDSCCKTIAKVIRSITGLKRFDKQFANIPNLKATPMWTYRQALRMRKARVREGYLSGRTHLNYS
jgi:very-short-patch-repair endonuclease